MQMEKVNSIKAWLLAARPKTLTGAVIPVMLGTSLAVAEGTWQWTAPLLCALFACGMQVAANFVNDYYDFVKGADREDRLGPERACAQGWITPAAMKKGIGVSVVLSCLAGLVLFAMQRSRLPFGGWELVAVGLLCVLFCFLYTTRLSYMGWGDVLVLVFFGWVPVCGTYYVQAHALTASAVVVGTICGLVTDALLVINNYRDREQDALHGKRTVVVRFGEPFGRYLFLGVGMAAAALSLYLIYNGTISWRGFMFSSLIYLYLHVRTWVRMAEIRRGRELNLILGENSRNMLVYGVLLSLAIIVG